MAEDIARARSAWYQTCQQQNCLVLASCMLLPFYSNALWLACTVVVDHLRFHVGMRVPLVRQLVAFLHLWFYLSAVRFRDRHVTQNSRKAGFKLGQYWFSRVHRLWIVACVLTSVRAQEESSTGWSLSKAHSIVCCSPPWQALKLLRMPHFCTKL
eukprot:5333126-Amphidinium_carterae.1